MGILGILWDSAGILPESLGILKNSLGLSEKCTRFLKYRDPRVYLSPLKYDDAFTPGLN